VEDIHQEACRYQMINAVNSPIIIIDLRNVGLLKYMNNVKLTLNGTCLYMKSTTVLFFFELEQYVEHVFYELGQYTHDINKKFEYFVSFLKQNYIINKSDAANTLYKIYDKISIIECELIAYVLDNIVYAALHEK